MSDTTSSRPDADASRAVSSLHAFHTVRGDSGPETWEVTTLPDGWRWYRPAPEMDLPVIATWSPVAERGELLRTDDDERLDSFGSDDDGFN